MVRDREINEIVKCLKRDDVLEFTAHTIVNLDDLYGAAKTLIEEKALYGVGLSLAISALEELGKLFLSLGYLTNQFSADRFARSIYPHRRKQDLGKVLAWIAPLVSEIGNVKKDVEGGISLDDFIADFLKVDLDPLEKKLSSDSFLSDLENILKQNLEERRQNGLYVSLTNRDNHNLLSYPRQVTEAEAKRTLRLIGAYHDTIAQLVLHGPELKLSSSNEHELTGEVSLEKIKILIDEICKKLRCLLPPPVTKE